MPYEAVVKRRLNFLQIDEATSATLREVHPLLEGAIDDLLDRFYAHILQQPELKPLFSDDESVERARAAQKEHWLETLSSMNIGQSQCERAEQIGQAHVRVGLTPSWYMGSYCFMLNQFVDVVAKRYQDDPMSFSRAITALNKAVFLDMNFVIDSYLETKDKMMRELLRRATSFTEDVKHLQRELANTAQELQARSESFVHNIRTGHTQDKDIRAQDFLRCSVELSDHVRKLDSRLAQLETDDRLYLHRTRARNVLTRIKAFVESHLPHS